MSSNLLDEPKIVGGASKEGNDYIIPKYSSATKDHEDCLAYGISLPKQTGNRRLHVGFGHKAISASDVGVWSIIGYRDDGGHVNWASVRTSNTNTAWNWFSGYIFIPAGMTPFSFAIATVNGNGGMRITNVTLSYDSPIALAVSEITATDVKDGKSPTVSVSKSGTVTTIVVTNADGSKATQTVNDGANGTPGAKGAQGPAGPGVPSGGTAGQILTKKSATSYDTQWVDNSVATTTKAGLMSAGDKAKLDGIAAGANKYIHPGYTARSSGLYKVTVDGTGHVSAATAVTKADITALGIPGQDTDTKYSDATTSAHGLMSASDKSKLNGIASGATKNVSTVKSFTLSASSWSSGSYTISNSLITASSNQEVLPATTITAAQYNSLSKAQIIDGGQSAGKLTLKALGTVPTIDIPIRIIFRGTI